MSQHEREWLLRHLDHQARYVVLLTAWARDNPADADVLLRVRDEVFTLRETLDTLGVAGAVLGNEAWNRVPHAEHKESWPSAEDDPS